MNELVILSMCVEINLICVLRCYVLSCASMNMHSKLILKLNLNLNLNKANIMKKKR